MELGRTVTGVSKAAWAAFTVAIVLATIAVGRSWGMIAIPPRRETVSAIRLPEMAVMFATTRGSGSDNPSVEVKSTSRREVTEERRGAMNTSS